MRTKLFKKIVVITHREFHFVHIALLGGEEVEAWIVSKSRP